MKNIGAYYRDTLGWSAGPHLFLAAETQYDGIFQGTPLTTQGIHAGPCNYSRLGIEVVGNFNLKPWGPEVSALVYGVAILLMDWAKIPIKEVWVHRECMPGHTDCPGKQVSGDTIRADLYTIRQGLPEQAPVYTRIIGVPPSCTIDEFWRSIERNMPLGGSGEPLITRHDSDFVYNSCAEFGVDPNALLGMWAKEQGTMPYGKSPLGQISRNPHNMRAPDDDWRWTVLHPVQKKPFYAYESWKIGLIYAMLHLKNYYGGFRRLYTLEEIVAVFAPVSDGNNPVEYVRDVKATMAYITSH
jgi:hypothetical protein